MMEYEPVSAEKLAFHPPERMMGALSSSEAVKAPVPPSLTMGIPRPLALSMASRMSPSACPLRPSPDPPGTTQTSPMVYSACPRARPWRLAPGRRP